MLRFYILNLERKTTAERLVLDRAPARVSFVN